VLGNSSARWKVVANSISLTSMFVDLRTAPVPPQLRARFYLNTDQFDGFPTFRRRLNDFFAQFDGVALVAGDIHAAFATEHPGGVWEFIGPAVSSFALLDGVESVARADPLLSSIPGFLELLAQLDSLLVAANPTIRYANTAVNGVVVFEASNARLSATYWQIDGGEATSSYYDRPLALARKLTTKRFDVRYEPGARAPAAPHSENEVA
jgi:alkaline phosphatase D